MKSDTPRTDDVAFYGCVNADLARQLERENIIMRAALERIAKCDDAPEIDATGEWQFGLHCGVEDRCIQDRYEGADYGHTVGVERALEWAVNEANHALSQIYGEAKPVA